MSAQDHFETLPAGRRNWAVAAIHGEADRLRALHRRLAGRIQVGENLVYLGNFLGRGNAVAETIEELLLFRRALLARPGAEYDDIVYLRGSQEEMWHKLLQIQFAPNPREVLEWMLDQGVAPTLAAYGGTVEEARSAGNGGALVLTTWTSSLLAAMRDADGHTLLISVPSRAAFTEAKPLPPAHAGTDPTRPCFLYRQRRFPLKLPGVLALGAIILMVSFIVVVFSQWLRRRGIDGASSSGL